MVSSSLILVLLPSLYLKRNNKIDVISDAGSVGRLGKVVDFGMFVGGVFYLLFALSRLSGIYESSPLSLFVLYVSSISLSMGGLTSKKINANFHRVFIYIFFITSYIGGFLFNFSFLNSTSSFILLQSTVVLGGIGTTFLYKFKPLMKAQVWGVIFGNFWIILLYLLVL